MPLFFFDEVSEGEYLGIWKIEETYNFFIDKINLSIEEKLIFESFKNESRKAQWLSCRVLVNVFMKGNGIDGHIYYNTKGHPQLTTGHFISISHTPYFSALIISKNNPVGIDIEKISERILKIKSRMASDEELMIAGGNLQNLITIWASKEAIYKVHGIKELDFKNDIFLDLSKIKNDCLEAKVSYHNAIRYYILKRKIIEDHIMIYVSN